MNIKPLLGLISACLIIMSFSTISAAALINRGGGLIYDNVLDITWLQDANYAKTNGDDADGMMIWSDANTWAANLTYYDSVRNVTYDDWRLPTTSPVFVSFMTTFSSDGTTDRGTAATTTDGTDGGWRGLLSGTPVSEMGHMYYVNLANLGACDPSLPWCTEQTGWGLNNTGPFSNIQPSIYWSATEFDNLSAWSLDFSDGTQSLYGKGSAVYAWAVRDGNVVPVPAAVWLFGSGLVGLVGLAKRKRNQPYVVMAGK